MALGSILLEGPAGRLETLLKLPEGREPTATAVVAHPHPLYGGNLHNKVVYATANALAEQGAAVLRFNFRGVGTSGGRHDHGVGERDDFRAAVAEMRRRYPALPLLAAGYSFGSHVATAVGADGSAEAMLALAPPTGFYDFSFLHDSAVPLAGISGDEDALTSPDDLATETRCWRGVVFWEVLPGVGHDLASPRGPLDRALERALRRLLAATGRLDGA